MAMFPFGLGQQVISGIQQNQQNQFLLDQERRKAAQDQAAQQAAGNALPALLRPPPQTQTPSPGQPSVPMMQPGQMQQQPPMPPQGMQQQGGMRPPLPPGIPPLPQGMPPGMRPGMQGQAPGQPSPPRPQQPMPPQPYRPMPTQPSMSMQGHQGGGIPQMPPRPQQPMQGQQQNQQGGLNFDQAVKALQSQGLSGAELFQGFNQLWPVLSASAKAQVDEETRKFRQNMQDQMLDYRRDALAQREKDSQLRANRSDQWLDLQKQNFSNKQEQQKVGLLDPDSINRIAMLYRLEGPDKALKGVSRQGSSGRANIAAINDTLTKLGASPSELIDSEQMTGARKKEVDTSAASLGKVLPLINEIDTQTDILLKASQNVPRTFSPLTNKMLQFYKNQTGDPAMKALAVAAISAKGTYANMLGRGASTDATRREADLVFDTIDSPEALAAAIATVRKESENIKRAFTQAVQNPMLSIGGMKSSKNSNDPIRIQTEEDYKKLPSGALFIAPDGKTRRKR